MFSKSSKALTLALFVAGGMQVGAMTSATAATLPSVGSMEILQTTETDGKVHKVHRRAYRHYHRRRHGPRYRRRRPGHRHYYNGWWYATPWYLAPLIAPAPAYGRAHVRWCLDRYRSYNPRTDRFLGYDGHYHRCRSPYRRY